MPTAPLEAIAVLAGLPLHPMDDQAGGTAEDKGDAEGLIGKGILYWCVSGLA